MQTERPYVLTIAGFDPCSGAGLTADIKTFEQLKVYGLAVCTGMTAQTEDNFVSVEWRSISEVKKETEMLLDKYPVKAVKFGIVPSFVFLSQMVSFIKSKNKTIKIIIDPVWKSSTGFVLNDNNLVLDEHFLSEIELFTPNVQEFELMRNKKNEERFIDEFTQYSNLLLKGGHKLERTGTDTLYTKNFSTDLVSFGENISAKHGSGCVLSAAITAFTALEKDLAEACALAKLYTEKFLSSNKSLLGYHAS